MECMMRLKRSFEELDSKSRTRETAVGIEYVRDVARRTRLQWFVWSYEKHMSQLNKYLDQGSVRGRQMKD